MGTSGSWPNFDGWLDVAWGSGAEFWSSGPSGFFGAATNLVFGTNPPYTLDDFQAYYPKYFGLATALAGCGTTQGSPVVTVPNLAGLAKGQFVQSSDLSVNSVIVALGSASGWCRSFTARCLQALRRARRTRSVPRHPMVCSA